MILITIVTGDYKQSYNWGAHIVQLGVYAKIYPFPEKLICTITTVPSVPQQWRPRMQRSPMETTFGASCQNLCTLDLPIVDQPKFKSNHIETDWGQQKPPRGCNQGKSRNFLLVIACHL
jgi:hypothetical protein